MVDEDRRDKEDLLDKELEKSVSRFSEAAQKNQAIERLVTSKEDSMYDLDDTQITAMALFRSLDKNVVEIPGVMSFLDEYASLSRSKDRAGRYEYAASHAQRLISYVKSMPMLPDGSNVVQPGAPQQGNASLWSKVFGGKKE